MKSKKFTLNVFKYLCFADAVVAFIVSILFFMEISIGEPRHGFAASLACGILFMVMSSVFLLGFFECRTKLKRLL